MSRIRASMRWALLGAVVVALTAPVGATTMIRMGLDELVEANQTVIVGEVSDVRSYWNEDHTFIFTDVTVRPTETLKGMAQRGPITLTVMGGTVDDQTVLIIAGPELVIGAEYVLFLNTEALPGTRARTVRDLSQGIFDVVDAVDGKRAVSQANRHGLLPNAKGLYLPPGGEEGLPLEEMIDSIRTIAGAPGTSVRGQ